MSTMKPCPKCGCDLVRESFCGDCGWEAKTSGGKRTFTCFRCKKELGTYADFVNVGTLHDLDGDSYYENVRPAHRSCMVGLKDWREDAFDEFWDKHPEFKVVPAKEEVSSMIEMAKKLANKKMPEVDRFAPGIEEKRKEDEHLALLHKHYEEQA